MTTSEATALTPEHRDFYERFKSFWADPSGQRVLEIIRPDARIHFTGAGTISGADYVGYMDGMLAAYPGMTVKAVDCAGDGERLYIFWETTSVINGTQRTFVGVDRFRLAEGMAIEEHVIFDSAVLQPEN
ncbi:nuclear transport factor 2 family protein [Brevundimonas sp.]|jgi:predicted SnoaL-like aldol condensation-catalyzing enzyme|uniref:nuclear transport factor 2 family protein n=1 Tax=Brevundimonas sp. TaxID=1871086 RepID=UPI002E111F06|nr:nuclear transport factor 2 family protein [Brevundimonas sp.]